MLHFHQLPHADLQLYLLHNPSNLTQCKSSAYQDQVVRHIRLNRLQLEASPTELLDANRPRDMQPQNLVVCYSFVLFVLGVLIKQLILLHHHLLLK